MKFELDYVKEFVSFNSFLDINLKVLNLPDESNIILNSQKKKISMTIIDLEDGYAIDNSLYIDYEYLEDGMKAWQVQYNSKLLD